MILQNHQKAADVFVMYMIMSNSMDRRGVYKVHSRASEVEVSEMPILCICRHRE